MISAIFLIDLMMLFHNFAVNEALFRHLLLIFTGVSTINKMLACKTSLYLAI